MKYRCINFCLLYLGTFGVILPLLCHRMQFSLYNLYDMNSKEGRDQLISENNIRIIIARQHKKVLKEIYSIPQDRTLNKPVDLAITVITTVRNPNNLENYQPLYLTQVIWKFLWLMNQAKMSGFQPNVLLSVCNVDVRPNRHQEATDLVPIIPVINRYGNDAKSFPNVNIFEKEKQDYVFCLNSSLSRNPKFVLLIEDDAYPSDDMFLVLEHLFRQRLYLNMTDLSFRQHHQYEHHVNNITYVKLYHPERLLSYFSLEPDRLTELFGVSTLFGTILVILYDHVIAKVPHSRSRINVIWGCFVVYISLVVIAIGRPHLLELRRLLSPFLYSYMSAPECCTPAMLFPRRGAQQVIDHLNSHPCYPHNAKDTVLDQFIKTEHRHAYIVQPNLFKHIGLFSSLREKFLNPYVV